MVLRFCGPGDIMNAKQKTIGERKINMHSKPKKKRRGWLIALLILLILFLLLAGAAALFLNSKLSLIDYSDGSIESPASPEDAGEEDIGVDLSGLEIKEPSALPQGEADPHEDVLNVLILGTDEHTEEFSSARADSIILLSLNLKEHTARLVSLERGMGVPILEGEYEGEYDWLTHCFRYGGASLMLKEVQTCFNVDVEHYVRVNFTSVENIVDLLGGIDVELTGAEAGYLNSGGYGLSAGMNHLDGKAALAYARLRAIDSDWTRVKRQRTVIQACMDSIKNADVKTLNALCDAILPYVQTNFTKLEILQLMAQLPNFLGVQFEQMTIPAEGTYGGMIGLQGRGLFAVDFETNSKILSDFLYGESEN